MKLTTKGRYGMRFMMVLAENWGQGPVLVDAIAKSQNISANYIHILATPLKAAGLVRAVRGPNGGYELIGDPSKITALSIIETLEGNTALVDCTSTPDNCPRSGRCAAQDLWAEIDAAVTAILTHRTLQDLVDAQRRKDGNQHMFHI